MIPDRDLIKLITNDSLTIVQIIDRVGTGDRCKKAAVSLVRQRLKRLEAKGQVRREAGEDGVFRFQILEPPKAESFDKFDWLAQMLPRTNPEWPQEWIDTWFNCAKIIARKYPIEIHVIHDSG